MKMAMVMAKRVAGKRRRRRRRRRDGGGRQRERWRWRRGWRASDSNEGKGDSNEGDGDGDWGGVDKEARERVMPKAMRVVRDEDGEGSKATVTAYRDVLLVDAGGPGIAAPLILSIS